jgi:hypothetical protein
MYARAVNDGQCRKRRDYKAKNTNGYQSEPYQEDTFWNHQNEFIISIKDKSLTLNPTLPSTLNVVFNHHSINNRRGSVRGGGNKRSSRLAQRG